MTMKLQWRRDRWFLLGLLFLILNGYAVLRPPQPGPLGDGVPAVETFLPGEGATLTERQALVWRFAGEVCPEGASPEEVATLRIEPHVPGATQWANPSEFRFTPDEPWPLCNRFVATLQWGTPDEHMDGAGRQAVFTVETPPLGLESARQVDFRPPFSGTIRLDFNAPPVRSGLEDALEVRDAEDKKLRVSILGDTEPNSVLVSTRYLGTETAHITVKQGLGSTAGPLALPRSETRKIQFVDHLQLVKIDATCRAFDVGEIQVGFSTSLKPDRLSDYIRIDPPVEFTCQLAGWRGTMCRLKGAFEPGKPYTVTFLEGLQSSGGLRLEQAEVRRVHMPNLPASFGFVGQGRYLSAAGSRALHIRSTGMRRLRVSAERVYPNNLVYFAMRQAGELPYDHSRHYNRAHLGLSEPPGDPLEVSLDPVVNRVVTNVVDLAEVVGDHHAGAFHVTVRADLQSRRESREMSQLVVVTDLGLSVKRGKDDAWVWVNSIRNAEPVAGAQVRAYSPEHQQLAEGTTDETGLVRLPLSDDAPFLVTAHAGEDVSYLILKQGQVRPYGDVTGRAYCRTAYDAFVHSDRGVYRPGEQGHLRALVRTAGTLQCPDPFPVELRVRAPDGKKYRTLHAVLSEWGTATFDVEWPHHAPTGSYRCELAVPGVEEFLGLCTVAVEDFVPPRIAVALSPTRPRTPSGEELAFDVTARHLTGRPAAELSVAARVWFAATDFSHPDWPDYVFADREKSFSSRSQKLGASRLDADGQARFTFSPPATWRPASALRAAPMAVVTTREGRTVTGQAATFVDVYPHYVGVRPRTTGNRVAVGDAYRAEVAVVTPDGAAAALTNLHLRVSAVSWNSILVKNSNGSYSYRSERRLQTVHESALALTDGRGALDYVPAASGNYLAVLTDRASGASASVQFYASGSLATWDHGPMEKPDAVRLTLDRERYRPGDTALLAVESPFPGQGLLTLESDRVVTARTFRLDGRRVELEVPVTRGMSPNVFCSVSVVRPLQIGPDPMPHRAAGTISLPVEERERRLNVQLRAPAEMRPGTTLSVEVEVLDHEGEGTPAEVTLAAVDEGICLLTAFKTPDAGKHFYAPRRLGVTLHDLYALLIPELDPSVLGTPSAPGGGAASALRGQLSPVRARRFRSVALWSGAVRTGPDGKALVQFDVPEFSGRLRLMALATAPRSYGSAQAPVVVKRPVTAYLGCPRFLAPRDEAVAKLILANESDREQTVEWSVTATGPVRIQPAHGGLILAAGREEAVPLQLVALAQPGVAGVRYDIAVGAERYKDGFELPVRPPAPRGREAGTLTVAAGEAAALAWPQAWLGGTEAHHLVCSPMPSLQWAGSLAYLVRYPYGCVEQTTSSAFPLLYLADLAAALPERTFDVADTTDFVRAGVLRLLSMQQHNGGFSYWPGGRETYDWGSVYATHFLTEALKAGYDVPQDRHLAAIDYLDRLLTQRSPPSSNPDSRSWQSDRTERAYAAYVLALHGQPPHGWLNRLLEDEGYLGAAPRALLAGALALADRRADAVRLLGPTGPADLDRVGRDTGRCLGSAARDGALLLNAWLDVDPDDARVAALVTDLQSRSAHGAWSTTQENAFALLALGKFAQYLGSERTGYEAELRWDGTAATQQITSEALWSTNLSGQGHSGLSITNSGPGAAYVYWSSEGVPATELPDEVDEGLRVRRELLDEDGNLADLTRLEAGQLLVIRLNVDTLDRTVDNLVLADLLPAGLEPENARLKTSQTTPWLKRSDTMPLRHLEIRDDRVIVFPQAFGGSRNAYYAVRAVTPGVYVMPPVSASCMYDPTIRSVHGAGRLEIKETDVGQENLK